MREDIQYCSIESRGALKRREASAYAIDAGKDENAAEIKGRDQFFDE